MPILMVVLWFAVMGMSLALVAFGALRGRYDERDDLLSAACILVGGSLFLTMAALTFHP